MIAYANVVVGLGWGVFIAAGMVGHVLPQARFWSADGSPATVTSEGPDVREV